MPSTVGAAPGVCHPQPGRACPRQAGAQRCRAKAVRDPLFVFSFALSLEGSPSAIS